ncbi:hypothetical protein GPX89_42410 [Nocardia sp. ET3-3]|uniref:Uncharacterized protein n=1 Tax=Nocardia terrae TaxID=2675851 RepID=A0A7K1VB48_9NOCA|nr:hypothetical protein [Nocardia terrae]MVU83870.1 hypothetical protein [Nocardia terrae]
MDLLFGATQATTLVALIPETLTYGCAALLIRGLARERGAGWAAVITWGLAFAVIAECLIVQTSLAPRPGAAGEWGRALGVNWPYLVWAVGYESCWAIALSIQLTDLVFPLDRETVWPSRRGRLVLAAVFVAGAIPTWYNWTHVVSPDLLHLPAYQPPLPTLALALVVVAALAILGVRFARQPARRSRTAARRTPNPLSAGAIAFLAAVSWFGLLLPEVNGLLLHVPVALPIIGALLMAAATGILLDRWSRTPGWDDRHRLMLILGAFTASMAAGFPANQFTTLTLIIKAGLNIAALAGLLALYSRRARIVTRS